MDPFRVPIDFSPLAGPPPAFRNPSSYRPPSPPRRRSSPANRYDVVSPPPSRKITPPECDMPSILAPKIFTAEEIAGWSPEKPPPMKPDGLSYRFPLQPAEFYRLEEMLRDRDESWPRYEYDGSKGLGIIQLMPSAIHGGLHDAFRDSFVHAIATLPAPIRRHFRPKTNVSLPLMRRGHRFSKKIPDFELAVRETSVGYKTVFALEMGFSQTYESLRNDVDEWFSGQPLMRMIVLLNVIERPRYRNPLAGVDPSNIIQRLQGADEDEVQPTAGLQWTGFTLRDLAFVGALTGYMEVWIRGVDGLPRMRGLRQEFIPERDDEVPLEFRLGEFSERPEAQDVVLPLSWETLRHDAWWGARELAFFRAMEVLGPALDAEADLDSDFVPTSGSEE
ncbi:MAG: hypothetical protein M1826_001587 [Phylliscum demangeonii]|nr:MAG: hypothetical protein M1826_001587 [Phylliscum demangeonii]